MIPGTPSFRISNLISLFSSPGPTCQPAPPLLLSVSLASRRTRRPAAGHPRLPCHVPAILASRANPSLLSAPQDPAPAPFPSTLTLSAPHPPWTSRSELRRRRGLSPSVSLPSILRGRNISYPSSSDSGANPAFSLTAQRRRRSPRPAAARRRCAAASPPFPAVRAPGEAHRQRLHPMRAFPSLL